MSKIARILVATDFSECSREALDFALALAGPLGAQVDLVHVFERPLYFEVGIAHSVQLRHDVDEWLREIKENAKRELEKLVNERRAQKPSVRAIFREGAPVDEVLKAAEEHSADLIVMGTHGRTGLPHVLLGSVAERVLRRATCPVLTVRTKPSAS